MKVSLNTVKQYIDFDLPSVDELVAKINAQLGGVEEVIDLGKRYEDATIAKVVKCEKHPNADKLSVCEIDAGTGENVQVVCGAPNVREGIFVVWLKPGSTVPSTYEDKEPFVLDARELRGVMSNGMLASAKELGIGDSHEGILEIDPSEWKPNDVAIKPGESFAKAFGLDDTIIDIENKMFTHRPDLFGQLGVAREIAGIHNQKFISPDWYTNEVKFEGGDGLELEVFNDAHEKVPRIMFASLKNIEIKPSPLWLQCALVAMGGKPINNIVDVTNYVMLLTAQPTHAYDYDKIRGKKIGARMARKGESIKLLNDKTYELTKDDIVIADGEGAIGLGGIMGGGDSEVDENTKSTVLEVATFDMYAVRKSAMRHGVFTDALTRFNKGQSPLQNDHIMNLLIKSIIDTTNAELGRVFDEKINMLWDTSTVSVSRRFIQDRLGGIPNDSKIAELLKNVEFQVIDAGGGAVEYEGTRFNDDGSITVRDNRNAVYGANMTIKPPFWRTDIQQAEDIVEEVGRLYGFDKLPRELPQRSMIPTPKNTKRELKQSIREALSKAGANEVLTYSFVHEKTLTRAGQDPVHAYQLSNALSPELQYYRIGLTPSLLDKIHMNSKAGYDKFALFELNKVHFKGEMDQDEPDVPNEDDHVSLVLAYNDKQAPIGAPFYYARNYLEQVLHLDAVNFVPLTNFAIDSDVRGAQLTAPYDPKRSAVVVKDDQVWGVVGEFNQATKRSFKLPVFSSGFEVRLDSFTMTNADYQPLSRYPSVMQDVSFKVKSDVAYEALVNVVESALAKSKDVDVKISPIGIYQSENDRAFKTITLRLRITSYEQTLSDSQVRPIIDWAVKNAKTTLNAEVI